MISKRGFITSAALAAAGLQAGAASARPAASGGAAAGARTASGGSLASITGGAQPITASERQGRIAKAQALMHDYGLDALLCEAGSAMEYFTGVQWWRSERLTCAVIPRRGEVVIITPAFEEPSVRETLAVPGDVRPWNEDESPFARIVGALHDRGVRGGAVGVEATVRFFVVDGLRQASPGLEVRSGEALVRACRMIKSPAELALMQAATDVTLAAYRHVYPRVRTGMGSSDISSLMDEATEALGGKVEFSMVLLNEASAYPHGSHTPQVVREGSVVLMDCGCAVHGYQSDVSRTWVHGEPTARQRKVWATVRRGQEIALETARLGARAGDVDGAVRRFYAREGWGPGFRLPGLSHRTGHGIGMDGHEPAYLVGNDDTRLAPGMCFSDEPGIYIPGEFGVRLEDCFHMTPEGPKLFSGLAPSIDRPI
jgi:Xaa-Pro dipeptidase